MFFFLEPASGQQRPGQGRSIPRALNPRPRPLARLAAVPTPMDVLPNLARRVPAAFEQLLLRVDGEPDAVELSALSPPGSNSRHRFPARPASTCTSRSLVGPARRLQGAADEPAASPTSTPICADPAFETGLALFHRRYSTNTYPNWTLAQPFRLLVPQRRDQHDPDDAERRPRLLAGWNRRCRAATC